MYRDGEGPSDEDQMAVDLNLKGHIIPCVDITQVQVNYPANLRENNFPKNSNWDIFPSLIPQSMANAAEAFWMAGC